MTFLILGLTFLILSFTTDQNAYLAIGSAFTAIGAAQKYRKNKITHSDEQEANSDSTIN